MLKFITPSPRFAALMVALALALGGCGDDDATGVADQKPPSVSDATAVDINHVEVEFSEELQRSSAEVVANYAILETVTPGDSLLVLAAALQADQRTVSLTTDTQGDVPYQLRVVGVADEHGNAITSASTRSFIGTTDPDVTAPALITSSPPANADDVPLTPTISMTFTEPVTFVSFSSGTTLSADSGPVLYSAHTDDGFHYTIVPVNPLEAGTEYTVTLVDLSDAAGNTMQTRTWVFHTTTVVSTSGRAASQ